MGSIEKIVTEVSNYSVLAEELFASKENSKQFAQQTMDIAKSGSVFFNEFTQITIFIVIAFFIC